VGQLEFGDQSLQGGSFLQGLRSSRWMFSISAMAMAA
jgi:hypothetical protein